MTNSFEKSNRIKNRTKGFILLPLVFVLITAIIFYAVISPIVFPFTSAISMLFLDSRSGQDNILYSGITNITSLNLKASEIELPTYGTMFGHIEIDDTQVDADLYFGDGVKQLNRGVGIYEGSSMPGFGKTILMAAHNNTFFSTLGSARVGSQVHINTNYGTYIYKVRDSRVANEDDATAYDLAADHENLIMYTCYPFDTLGLTPQRYFVYADYVSGPKVDINN